MKHDIIVNYLLVWRQSLMLHSIRWRELKLLAWLTSGWNWAICGWPPWDNTKNKTCCTFLLRFIQDKIISNAFFFWFFINQWLIKNRPTNERFKLWNCAVYFRFTVYFLLFDRTLFLNFIFTNPTIKNEMFACFNLH